MTTTASRTTTNITVSCDHELLIEIDAVIRTLNKQLPEMAQINRSRFVRGCIKLGLEQPEELLK
jgi:metal-responsive CopG/Arc/MetJ family transcriptional regulator